MLRIILPHQILDSQEDRLDTHTVVVGTTVFATVWYVLYALVFSKRAHATWIERYKYDRRTSTMLYTSSAAPDVGTTLT